MAVILPHFTNSELNCEELDCKPGVYTGLVDHASRLGIRLRTPGRTPYYNNGKRRFTDIKKNREGNSVQFYGEKVLLPVHMTPLADEAMLRPSTSRLSQRTTVKSSTSQSALSHLPQSEHGNLLPKIDVPVSSVPTETSVLLDSNRGKLWNKSGQALRFQQEQENREKSKALKRTSVIQSHRVDRMYYISGSSLPIAGKYEVDEKEMGKLQDMSQIRKKAPHYGRGLSATKRSLIGNADNDEIQVPEKSESGQSEHIRSQSGQYKTESTTGQNNTPDAQEMKLQGVGLERSKPASVNVYVVDEDATKTPQNSARTERTNLTTAALKEQHRNHRNTDVVIQTGNNEDTGNSLGNNDKHTQNSPENLNNQPPSGDQPSNHDDTKDHPSNNSHNQHDSNKISDATQCVDENVDNKSEAIHGGTLGGSEELVSSTPGIPDGTSEEKADRSDSGLEEKKFDSVVDGD